MTSSIVVDKTGRKISLRRVGVLEQLRLIKALGSDLSQNAASFGLAKIAAAVEMIDDIPILFPINESRVEAILERLDDHGVEAVGTIIFAEQENLIAEAGN